MNNNINKYFFNLKNLNIFFVCLLIFVIIPFNLSTKSAYDYDINLVFTLILITFLVSLIIIFFFLFIKKKNHQSRLEIILRFILFWVFLSGIFLPITGAHDPFFNISLSINKKLEIILKSILIISFFFIVIKFDKKSFFFRFIYIFIILNFFFIIFNIKKDIEIKYENKLNYFGKKNLIVISFDGISGYNLNKEISENLLLKKELKDFKFFKDVVSGAPYTWSSMNIELNGEFIEEKEQGYYNNILNIQDIDALTYNYYQFSTLKEKALNKGKFKNYNKNFKTNYFIQNFFISSVGRWSSPLGVFIFEKLPFQKLYKSFLNSIFFYESNKLNPFDKVNTIFNLDLFEFDLIFQNIVNDKDLQNVVRMYHFSFSHWPIVIDENCKEIKSLKSSIRSFDHENIVIKCISKKMIKVLNNLKKNGLYNNSLIIFKSDHGKPNYVERNYSQTITDLFKPKKYNKFYDKYPLNQKINDSFYWGFGRYKPFLLLKKPQHINDEIIISNKQVFLHDLSKTYCEFFNVKNECGLQNRNNLLNEETSFKNYKYDIYLPIKKYTGTDITSMQKYDFNSNISFYDSLKLNKIKLND